MLFVLMMSIEVVASSIMLVNLVFFNDFIVKNSLLHVNSIVSNFTWHNRRFGPNCRWAKLDKCLINTGWSHCFSSFFVTHLLRIYSDHSPLLLNARSRIPTRTKIFRFENYWLQYVQWHHIVSSDRDFKPHSSHMHAFFLIFLVESREVF